MVAVFYNEHGWKSRQGIAEDTLRWEDLREHAQEYVSKSRLRVMKHIPDSGDFLLDLGSGPIQYAEYLLYSRNFNHRFCVDLSYPALKQAQQHLGSRGVYLCSSWFQVDFKENFFDCSLCIHTLYHIHKDFQELAIRKLLQATQTGKPVIVVYSNPLSIMNLIKYPFRFVSRLFNWVFRKYKKNELDLYFYTHPLSWWHQFQDVAEFQIFPWRSFSSKDQKRIFPNNGFGALLFKILYYLEAEFPKFFVKFGQYPLIVLTKK